MDVLSCGFRSYISTVVLYAIATTCACFFVCVFFFSLLVYFQMLLVALRLDSPQRPWSVVGLVFTGVAAGCLVFLSIFVLFPFLCSSSFLVPRSGSALLHVKYCNKYK